MNNADTRLALISSGHEPNMFFYYTSPPRLDRIRTYGGSIERAMS